MSDSNAAKPSECNAAIIVAAGRGSRIGDDGEGPKQYRRIGSQTILAKTLAAFLNHPDIHYVQVVIHPDDADQYAASAPEHAKILPPVPGGATRQQSCLAGLEALADLGISRVLIHDAARPFVGSDLISGVLEGIEAGICALPATLVADTLKRASQGPDGTLLVAETVPRDHLYAAQTPQGFIFAEILEAHIDVRDQGRIDLTDDAAVAEHSGMRVRLVPGSEGNRKITTREDLLKARELEAMNIPDVRTGNGYDVHRLIEDDTGRGVILCGVEIAHSHRLDGHSDADVGLHALTDALLGKAPLIEIALAHSLMESDGNYEEAILHLENALLAEPRSGRAHRLLATAYGRQGHESLAKLHLAEEAVLQRRLPYAKQQAETALKGFEKGSRDWIKARDILVYIEDAEKSG